MQTTLLGIAIAIILALLTALVGPFFVDWSSYRGEFESRAKQLTGLDFRVNGDIDARILPTPSLILRGVEFGRPGEPSKVSARALRLEFSLGSLVRGEWRIHDASLESPVFGAGLDETGRVELSVPKLGFDLEGVAIDRLVIENGRAVLADASSGSRVVLEQVAFRGELRSLAGPIKGEGSFRIGDRQFPYRVSTGRISEDAGMKVRLAVDSVDSPLTLETDVTVRIEQGTPRFEGQIQVARPVGRAPAGAQSVISEPWRLSSRIKGDGTAAVLEQMEFQHGPDERAIKLRGSARVRFGRQPEINAVLSSPQLDLDRVLALPDATRRHPLAAIKALAESVTGTMQLPIPTTVSIAVEAVTLGGAVLQRVGADLASDGEQLEIKALELRAPGITQVRLGGRLSGTGAALKLTGAAKVDSGDPRALLAWLSERTDAPAMAGGMKLAGEVALGAGGIQLDHLEIDIGRMTSAGRFAYTFATAEKAARFDAALTAPDLDIDQVQALAKAMLGDTALDWPREGSLALKVARARMAAIEAKDADIDLQVDANGIDIRQLTIADFGGAKIAGKGRIDTSGKSPRGNVALDLDARSLDGLLTLADRFAPQVADVLRRSAGRLTPVALQAALTVDPAGASQALARFRVEGHTGAFRVALQGDGTASNDVFRAENLASLSTVSTNLSGRLEGDDGSALVELVGLDRWLVVDKRAARVSIAARGRFDGDLAIDGRLAAGSLDLSAVGAVRLMGSSSPAATLDLKMANASLRTPRPPAAGRPSEPLPATMSLKLVLDKEALRLTDLKGVVAGAQIGGHLALGLQQPTTTIEGDLDFGTLDLPGAVAAMVGVPARGSTSGANDTVWPVEPFEQGVRSLSGRVTLKSGRLALTPKLAVQDFRGVAHFGESQLALQLSEGRLAGGRAAGELVFLRQPEGVIARSRFKLAGANAAELLPGDGFVSGRLTLDVSTEGSGMSPVALVGSMVGRGTFTLENSKVARLDPTAFRTVIRAVDQGLPIDTNRVRDRMDAALTSGVLTIVRGEGYVTVEDGLARFQSNPTLNAATGTDLAVSASVNLADGDLDARLILTGAPGPGGPSSSKPPFVVVLLKGPVDAPKRTIDVTGFASWLALRAVEQQSKKLDVLEGREQPSAPPPAKPATPEARNPPSAGQPAAPTTSSLGTDTDPVEPSARPQNQSPQVPPPAPAAPKPQRPAATDRPPPVDLRPPRPGPGASRSLAPQPWRPRSLSEILFGR
ncbi:MAG: hypothetical protein C5B56_14645 [Proteobacteria bacterium]|nr:MAG: hypothetical protein C5B56_14645 [Pseudomonadota bacterium]